MAPLQRGTSLTTSWPSAAGEAAPLRTSRTATRVGQIHRGYCCFWRRTALGSHVRGGRRGRDRPRAARGFQWHQAEHVGGTGGQPGRLPTTGLGTGAGTGGHAGSVPVLPNEAGGAEEESGEDFCLQRQRRAASGRRETGHAVPWKFPLHARRGYRRGCGVAADAIAVPER